jgi:hypothetical protein
MFTLGNFICLVLLVILLLWILIQISPYAREELDGMKERLERWWAMDNGIHQNPHHFRHLVDGSRSFRHVGVRLRNLPRNATRKDWDPNCYFLNGNEYCVCWYVVIEK